MKVFSGKTLVVSVVAFLTVANVGAFAQGQRGGRRGGQMVTVAQIPVAYLQGALTLTTDENTRIAAIENKLAADTKAAQPADPTTLDQQGRRDLFTKIRALDTAASSDIEALLTDDQKTALKSVLKDVQALSFDGISPAALGELKLTDDQKTQLIKLGTDGQAALMAKIQDPNFDRTQIGATFTQARADAAAKTDAILNDDQKATLKKYPMPQGFGGFGGRRRQAPPAN